MIRWSMDSVIWLQSQTLVRPFLMPTLKVLPFWMDPERQS